MQYSVVHHSLPGTRTVNQDRYAFAERDNAMLMIVADGLGGYEGGELAAQTLTEAITSSFEKARAIPDPATFLVLSVTYAHSMINHRALKKGIDISLPRTTCVVCLIQNGYVYWAHVGDSRLYYIRDGEVVWRTADHSTSEHMLEEGMIDENELRSHNGRLLRCVGGSKRHEITLGPETQLDSGDTLILCTDGIWRGVKDERLLEKYANYERLDDALDNLFNVVERTNRRDCDNMTAVIFRWEDEPTKARPLFNMTIPKLDQRRLWGRVKKHDQKPSSGDQSTPSVKTLERGEIESTIEELESFVEQLDDMLEEDDNVVNE